MHRHSKLISAALFPTLLIAGCSHELSPEDRAMVQNAQRSANDAAASAQQAADAANRAAASSQQSANAAQSAADRADRMFQHSQRKGSQ